MSRCNNWPKELHDYVESKLHTKFRWGSHDCCMFAANWINILTGNDPAEPYRGTYSTRAGAQAILTQHNGIVAMMDKLFERRDNLLYTQRGDVVAFRTAGEEELTALGICEGNLCAFAGPKQLQRKRLDECQISWRIE